MYRLHAHIAQGNICAEFQLEPSRYFFPKMTGRMYHERTAQISFCLTFIGANGVFWTMMVIGVDGMPRRYYDYAQFPQFEGAHQFMTLCVLFIAAGFGGAIINWVWGALRGEPAGDNPWGSKSLEWTTDTPPPPGNWAEVPTIAADWHPYAHGRR